MTANTATIDAAATARFAPIGLAELNSQAALQTRVDRKYLLTGESAAALTESLDPRTQVLTFAGATAQRYRSVYFDTPELDSYHRAATRRRRRYKVRTRAYCDTGVAFVEVKTRGSRGRTCKERIPADTDRLETLGRSTREFVATAIGALGLDAFDSARLAPALTVAYERTTLLVPATQTCGPTRVTIDTHLSWRLPGETGAASFTHPTLAVVETKSATGSGPVDRALWRRGIRPDRFSKYATGLAALRPELPSNRWARPLRQAMLPYLTSTNS
ncbi:MAG TPA: polyphosphate polymerase domain-containing protein [Beutenbergiaceae bacterium]|nr:polyphosphate polymerase domain-containing protein [Beutenbergiaceae bacterium]